MELITYERTGYGYKTNTPGLEEVRKRGLEVLQGNNWLTPLTVGFVLIPDGFCEITQTDYKNDFVNYGVTTVTNKQKNKKLSQGFLTYSEVVTFIDNINNNKNGN